MTAFRTSVEVAAPADRVWERLVDWPAHTRWAPGTTVRVTTPLATGVGARFVGRTSLAALGLDRLGFDDPMEVTRWEPPTSTSPGRCDVRKLGRVVRGTARMDVVPLPATPGSPCTRVEWSEDLVLAPVALTRLAAPAVALAGRLAFGYLLRSMAAEVESEVEAGVGSARGGARA
ncbi:SRPBCC family protein [Aquipuribacter nitratireducens]|uniref:SRPBCC family protein n=1 Tax=Aquipuribacter nitratireducens TaxID=650104 RepID=A0ABW0GLA8_9MICO